MRRLLSARYVLVAGAKEAIPAWFQHAAVSKKFTTEDTPKCYLRFGFHATTAAFWRHGRCYISDLLLGGRRSSWNFD
jgi:hypothetical protein